MIKELYPEVISDLDRAKETWLRGEETEDLIDTRKWLEEEGLVEAAERTTNEKDYKVMYFELKKKYDALLNHVKKLSDFIKEP